MELAEARRGLRVPGHPGAPVPRSRGSNKVGLLAEIPDFAAFEAFMKTDAAAAAVRHDGVRLETMVLLAES